MRLAVLLLSLALWRCVPFGEGEGQASGSLRVTRCTVGGVGVYAERFWGPPEALYELRPTFFGVQISGNVMQIRLQRDPRGLNHTDAIVIDVRDVRKAQVGTPIAVAPDLEPEGGSASPARLAMILKDSCPRFLSNLVGEGTLTFTELDPRDGGRIAGTFDVILKDAQTIRTEGTAVSQGEISGSFRIPLHLVPPPG